MTSSEILAGWQNKKIRTELSSGGSVEGKLLRADAVGGLFELDKLSHATPAGPIEVEASEDTIPAYCFIPWTQVKMMIPFPDELEP
jgi:hypothetical protein